MPVTLNAEQLCCQISPSSFDSPSAEQLQAIPMPSWIGQSEAQAAARFGLGMQQPGFHLMVIGAPGCGRSSLMLQMMHEAAKDMPTPSDLLYLYHFEQPERPLALRVDAGCGTRIKQGLDHLVRLLSRQGARLLADKSAFLAMLDDELTRIRETMSASAQARQHFDEYLAAIKLDILDNAELFQSQPEHEGLLEAYLARFRANLLVDNRQLAGAPVIYDDDPDMQSLFGLVDNAGDQSAGLPEQMRLRAGNLLKADGGMLMLHLRDLHHDQHNGPQILEKLHRFLRNGRVQIEEPAGAPGHNPTPHFTPDPLPVMVKVVLVASREEYYQLQEEAPDFARFFCVKVDFSDDMEATPANYRTVATYTASICSKFGLPHFTPEAMSNLLIGLHRLVEEQTRISSNLGLLQSHILESAHYATARGAQLVEASDVKAAASARYLRHAGPEQRLMRMILNGEVMIRLQGREVGQVNGLTHIDMGDAGFGSPVRISARCYAGEDGVINIDREVEMTGPNHDKGLFILQHWLSATFSRLTPLSLNASLVFEQEYHGVEGDSASCAELYALISAIAGLPLPQGVAVTGAMNQHGEVMAVGGINEKIEGFFRLCEATGLDGSQGVMIPSRNASHLVLNEAVIEAVRQEKFHIYTFDHVMDGITLLTGMQGGEADAEGKYPPNTVLGRVQSSLENLHRIHESNKSED